MNNIDFTLQHLQFVLSSVIDRQATLRTDLNDSATTGDFANAAACQSTIAGLMIAETILRDQIRGLKVAQGVSA